MKKHWVYTTVHLVMGDDWYECLRKMGHEGWEAWYLWVLPSGAKEIYFKREV